MLNGKRIIALCTYRIYEAQEFDFLSELGRIMPEHDCFLFIYAMNSEIGIIDDDSYPYDPSEIVPHLDKIMETGQPIIFNFLIYMEKCMGFVCYSYPRTMLSNSPALITPCA